MDRGKEEDASLDDGMSALKWSLTFYVFKGVLSSLWLAQNIKHACININNLPFSIKETMVKNMGE